MKLRLFYKKIFILWTFLVFLAVLRWKLEISIEGTVFWAFTVVLFYKKWDSRISIGLALACLVTLPVLLSLFNYRILLVGDIWAERVAVWAFYFLSIGVVKQIWELKTESGEEIEEIEKPKPKKYYVPLKELPVVKINEPKILTLSKARPEHVEGDKKVINTEIKNNKKAVVRMTEVPREPRGKILKLKSEKNVLVVKKPRVRRVKVVEEKD